MKILFAADGSKFTKKALAFLVNREELTGPDGEEVVLNVQAPVPGRVKSMLGSANVAACHAEESQKVLEPIERFLKRHKIAFRTLAVVGTPPDEILRAANQRHCGLIVLGVHHAARLASHIPWAVAYSVVRRADCPVLTVRA